MSDTQASSGTTPQLTQRQIVEVFQRLQQELQAVQEKLFEIHAQAQEHEVVISALEPLDRDRKAFRLMGGVLVERTVGQVLPVLQTNAENLKKAVESHTQLLERKRKELAVFQTKYKVQVKSSGNEERAEASASGQGLLC